MSNLVYRTTSTDRTVAEALIEAAQMHGMGRVAVEDPVAGALTYSKLLLGAARARRQADAARERGQGGRRDAAERQRRGGDALRR